MRVLGRVGWGWEVEVVVIHFELETVIVDRKETLERRGVEIR